MPQQLLLEGPDLEALLLRARDEYGPGVTVVRAEKVRSGGFLGFFTREHFELTLEVPDAEPGALLSAPRSAPRSVEQQAAAAQAIPVESRERQAGQIMDSALAAEIADAEAAREAMLASVAGTNGHADAPVVQPPAPEVAPAAPVAQARALPVESTDMAEFDRLVLQLTASVDAPVSPADAPASGVDAPNAPVDDSAVQQAPESPDTPTQPTGRTFVRAAFPPASPEAGPGEQVVLNRWGVFTDVASVVATRCTVPALLALGVPRRYVRDVEDLDEPIALLDVVASFGTAPVRRLEPGDLLVIVGAPDQAVTVATQVAAWMGMPATSVALAGQIEAIRGHGRRIRNEEEARAARRRADQAAQVGEPLIVALGITPGRRGAAAAAPMVAAFGADAVWAVVDATKRAAANEADLKVLAAGSRVDAVAAVGLADAQAPAAVLDSSLPIAWMDGLPAASVVWAALLGERIAAFD